MYIYHTICMLFDFLFNWLYNYFEVFYMNKKTDLRIVKTKKVLFDTLIKLMRQKNFDKIKISDICDEALINRSTFYAHYEDKYELLDDFIEDLKMSLLKDLEDNVHNINTKEYIMKLLSILIDHIDEKRDIYSAIFLNNRNGFLVDFLIDVIERESLERLKNNNDIVKSELPLDILVKFYAGGLINVCVSWLTRKEKYNKEELLGFIDKLIPEKI